METGSIPGSRCSGETNGPAGPAVKAKAESFAGAFIQVSHMRQFRISTRGQITVDGRVFKSLDDAEEEEVFSKEELDLSDRWCDASSAVQEMDFLSVIAEMTCDNGDAPAPSVYLEVRFTPSKVLRALKRKRWIPPDGILATAVRIKDAMKAAGYSSLVSFGPEFCGERAVLVMVWMPDTDIDVAAERASVLLERLLKDEGAMDLVAIPLRQLRLSDDA